MKQEFEVIIFDKTFPDDCETGEDHEHIIVVGHNQKEAEKKAIKVFLKHRGDVKYDLVETNPIETGSDRDYYISYCTIDSRGNKDTAEMTGRAHDSERQRFMRKLIDTIVEFTGCGIQHNGCPCNTCFHTFCANIGMSDKQTYEFWKIILVLRGDYTEEQIRKYEEVD